MKNRKRFAKILTPLLALLLLSTILLSSCDGDIVDPIGDTEENADFAPYLSVEEADALFGATASAQFDGPYLYYTAKRPGKGSIPGSSSPPLMAYRYNCETGEVAYACQDSTCTHGVKSSCPFARLVSNGDLSVMRDGIVYLTWEGEYGTAVNYYDMKTGERKIIDYDTDMVDGVGSGVYYQKFEMEFDSETFQMASGDMQLWRYDIDTGKSTMVTKGDMSEFYPFLLDGRETVLELSIYDPAGDPTVDEGRPWYYKIDVATGERSLLWDSPLYGYLRGFAGEYLLFEEYDFHYYDTHDEGEPESVWHLLDHVTKEDRVIEEIDLSPLGDDAILTDRCLLFLTQGEDGKPDGGGSRVLRSIDLSTLEETVYPMECSWYGFSYAYSRGRLYSTDPFFMADAIAEVQDPEGSIYNLPRKTLLEWDICTGRQRLLDGNEVFLPEKDPQD